MFVLIYDLITKEEYKITMNEFHEFFNHEAPKPTAEIQEYDDFIYHKTNNQAVYAIYKGDKFEDVGTILELNAKLDIKKDTIKFMASPFNLRRATDERRIAIRIDNLVEE